MRVLLVANETAQSGRAKDRIEKTLERMRDRGWDAEFLATEPEGRTVATLRERIVGQPYDTVVYMGGDGTFREVAKGILAAGGTHHMGMLPSGTANDQGKSFGVSHKLADLDENLRIMEADYVIELDVGQIQRLDEAGEVTHEERFFDSAGWGLQADILWARNRDRERVGKVPVLRDVYRDQAVYAGAAVERTVHSWFEPTKFAVKVLGDGGLHTYDSVSDIIINATPIYAGSWVPDRNTRPDDGFFELIPMAGRRDTLSKLFLDHTKVPSWKSALESVGVQHAQGFSAQRFELELDRPSNPDIRSQIDGEEWVAGSRYRVKVLKRQLKLVVPQYWEPPWGREG
jgi:diacylglycerol kinase family enzyme